MRRQSSSARSTKACRPVAPTPALAKQPSSRPKARRVPVNASSIAARSVTSQVRASTGAPQGASSAIAARFFSGLRPQIETAQPAPRERLGHAEADRAAQETVFDGPRLQPFVDHPSDDAVRDSGAQLVGDRGPYLSGAAFFELYA